MADLPGDSSPETRLVNRHIFYLVVLLGLVVISGIVALIRPLRASGPQQHEEVLITPRMAKTLER